MRKNLENYVRRSSASVGSLKERFLNNIPIYIKDSLPEGFDLDYVVDEITRVVPQHLMTGVDCMYIGQFDEFGERDVNAYYENGALFITNNQDNEDDLIDDVVHEIAHALEEVESETIYADDSVEVEFLGKRKRMYHILKAEYGSDIDKMAKHFMQPEYSTEFDEFLYHGIGYPKLTMLLMGLFASPFASTSLREYFARAFEEYYIGDREYLKKISPMVYNKVKLLDTGENNEY